MQETFRILLFKVTKSLTEISDGKIDESLKMEVKTKDEVGIMTQALNKSIDGLKKKAEFANLIGSGEINTELDMLSNHDVLGTALLNMRNNLQKARKQEDERKIEDDKRRWSNEGLAKFSEILRQNNDDLEVLARNIVRNLIYYIEANQGGLFILNDSETEVPIFELMATFAYNREKFIKRQIELGEGLVGTCAQEKQTIHLTEIPQNYVQIRSGLGGC